MRSLLTVFLLLLVGRVRAYEYGPPDSACQDMTPQHSPDYPQTTEVPYAISLDSSCYTPGQPVQVTLSSPSGNQFRGLFVQARHVNDNSNSFGTFDTMGDPDLQTKACFHSDNQNSIAHYNPSIKDFDSKTFSWTAPDGFTDDIVFVATVVQTYDVFWTGLTQQLSACQPTCQPMWQTNNGVHARGATQVNGTFSSADDCQNFCLSLANCVAVDVNFAVSSKIQCWVFTDPATLVQKYWSTNINNYYLEKSCPCSDKGWFLYIRQNSFGGQLQQPLGQSVNECLKLCESTSGCTAFDYDRTKNANCYFYFDDSYNKNQGPNGFVDQYVYQPC